MNSRLQTLREKYLQGWERQATLILLASALLLTLHRYYSRRRFFQLHFAEYFGNAPLAESYSYYYWFLTTALTLLLVPALVAKFGTRARLSDYGIRLGNQKLGWSVTLAAWILMIPVVILAVIVYRPFLAKYPLCKVVANSWQTFLLYQLAYGVYHVFMGIFLPRVHAIWVRKAIRKLQHPHPDYPICGNALFQAFAGGTRFNCCRVLLGILALETRSFIYGAAIHWLVAMTMDVVVVSISHLIM